MGSSSFIKKLTGIRISVEIKEGRVVVSGREYFAEHSYITGFEKAEAVIGNIFKMKIDFDEPPDIRSEGSFVRIGTDIPFYDDASATILYKKIDKPDSIVVNVNHIDLKIRKEGFWVLFTQEGLHTIKAKLLEIKIGNGKDMIINVLTRPFISAWIYSIKPKYLTIKKDVDRVLAIIQ